MTLKPSSLNMQQAYIDVLTVTSALQKLGVSEKDCLVVEDSVIGLQVYQLFFGSYFIKLGTWRMKTKMYI